MAESEARKAKRKMLQERYGINFFPPVKNKGGRPKGSKNKKKPATRQQ